MFCYIFPHFKGGSEITLGTTAVETCDLLFGPLIVLTLLREKEWAFNMHGKY